MVAQLVEQTTVNRQVPGSSPGHGAKIKQDSRMFMLTDEAIANLAIKAEKAIGCWSNRNNTADRNVIENAIRSALMAQAQQLITVVPASALKSHGLLDLDK